jgi:hypothetical protein
MSDMFFSIKLVPLPAEGLIENIKLNSFNGFKSPPAGDLGGEQLKTS